MARNVLWVEGTFDQGESAITAAVNEIGPTDFDVVILAFLHVHDDQSLYYNDTPVGQLWSGVPAALNALKNDYPTKKTLLASIGGWGNAADFSNAAANLTQFWSNLSAFCQANAIDGIDFDFESPYDATYLSDLADMAKTIKTGAPDMLLTAAPYTAADWWLGKNGLLAQTAVSSGGNLFDWLNVQFYAGSSNIDPSQWPANFAYWLNELVSNPNGITQADGPAFLVPGCNATDGFGTQQIAQAVANTIAQYPSMGGAFVWNYSQIAGSAASWASAIDSAFGG